MDQSIGILSRKTNSLTEDRRSSLEFDPLQDFVGLLLVQISPVGVEVTEEAMEIEAVMAIEGVMVGEAITVVDLGMAIQTDISTGPRTGVVMKKSAEVELFPRKVIVTRIEVTEMKSVGMTVIVGETSGNMDAVDSGTVMI
jgi:hypothetical protein